MAIISLAPSGLDAFREAEPFSALLDVREVEEANAGHIPTSSPLPLRVLPYRLSIVLPALHVPVIVADQGGEDRRAHAAAALLEARGYERVLVLEGGLDAWVEAGGRPERGQNVPSKRFGELLTQPDNELHIHPETLAAWLEEGRDVQVIDVRTDAEHSRECLPGAVHAPGFSIAAVADPSRPIVVHCSGRTRSILGSRTLRMLGFENVWALENGTMGWVLDGREVERGVRRPALETGLGGDPAIVTRARDLALSVGVAELGPLQASMRLAAEDGRPRQFIDVRELRELADGTAVGAVQVPSGQIVQRTDEHVVTRGAGLVLIDDGGARAFIAAHWLRLLGVEEVSVVAGGMDAWRAAGLPVGAFVKDPDPAGLDAARALVTTIDVEGALMLLEEGATVLSVDYSDVYARGHLEGASWSGLSDLLAGQAIGLPQSDAPVLLTCADGRASLLAAAALRSHGFERVVVLEGGTAAWCASGQQLVADRGNLPEWPTDVHPHPLTVGEHAMRAYLSWEEELDVSQDAERVLRLTGEVA
jgi:rhodanese-related sulfurtransferase